MSANILDWTAWWFASFVLVAAFIALGSCWAFKRRVLGRRQADASFIEFTALELAILCAGKARAADVLALELVRSGHLALGPGGKHLRIGRTDTPIPPAMVPLMNAPTLLQRSMLTQLLHPLIEPVRTRLAQEGLALSEAEVERLHAVAFLLVAPVIVLILMKFGLDIWHGQDAAYLLMLLVPTLIANEVVNGRMGLATTVGVQSVVLYARRNDRARRAPLPSEVIVAFAMVGEGALQGTDLDGYGAMIKASKTSYNGCGGDGGCGGCG